MPFFVRQKMQILSVKNPGFCRFCHSQYAVYSPTCHFSSVARSVINILVRNKQIMTMDVTSDIINTIKLTLFISAVDIENVVTYLLNAD